MPFHSHPSASVSYYFSVSNNRLRRFSWIARCIDSGSVSRKGSQAWVEFRNVWGRSFEDAGDSWLAVLLNFSSDLQLALIFEERNVFGTSIISFVVRHGRAKVLSMFKQISNYLGIPCPRLSVQVFKVRENFLILRLGEHLACYTALPKHVRGTDYVYTVKLFYMKYICFLLVTSFLNSFSHLASSVRNCSISGYCYLLSCASAVEASHPCVMGKKRHVITKQMRRKRQ